jgi:4,5-dihydroxyphthalate decarboxylase
VSSPVIHLGLRDWDHLVPLVSGQVTAPGFTLRVDTRDNTPDVLADPNLDGGETSFSRYVQARAAGDDRLVGIPAFVMRGFRHRCVLVRSDSPLTRLSELDGKRIGLTGWPDSGNTWTRALLRAEGVGIGSVDWRVGPLVVGESGKDRLGSRPLPPNVSVLDESRSLEGELAEGRLDAVLTPFMPSELFTRDSRFRHLLADHANAERAYWKRHGFVPGIHLVTLRREVAEAHPELPGALLAALEQSKRRWVQRRRVLADTTPWLLRELTESALLFGDDWMPYGVEDNTAMIRAFCEELRAQDVCREPIDPAALFPEPALATPAVPTSAVAADH